MSLTLLAEVDIFLSNEWLKLLKVFRFKKNYYLVAQKIKKYYDGGNNEPMEAKEWA